MTRYSRRARLPSRGCSPSSDSSLTDLGIFSFLSWRMVGGGGFEELGMALLLLILSREGRGRYGERKSKDDGSPYIDDTSAGSAIPCDLSKLRHPLRSQSNSYSTKLHTLSQIVGPSHIRSTLAPLQLRPSLTQLIRQLSQARSASSARSNLVHPGGCGFPPPPGRCHTVTFINQSLRSSA